MAEVTSGIEVHTVLVLSSAEAAALEQFFIDHYPDAEYDPGLERVGIAIGAV